MGPVYAIAAYPKEVSLRDGSRLTVRPLEKGDEQALLEFFLGMPEEDRFFLKDDVTSPQVIQGWVDNLDYERALPLAAFEGQSIIAEGGLVRCRGNDERQIGDIRIAVAPKYRNRGLGTLLIRELCDIADDAGVEKIL